MSSFPEVLWLTVNPALKPLDRPLLNSLAERATIAQWEFGQEDDEPCCLETALALLHDYVHGLFEATRQPLHLVGHGLGGVLAWLYAQRYPAHVRSLTLLSVGERPAITWHARYYALRRLLPCSRSVVLGHMVRLLFGPCSYDKPRQLAALLQQDLDRGLSLHSLARPQPVELIPTVPPLLVCCGGADFSASDREGWQPQLKPGDRWWACPGGHHFFHFEQPRAVAAAITAHWQRLSSPAAAPGAGGREQSAS